MSATMRCGADVGFAIADTGSMSAKIGAVRTALNNYSSGPPLRSYDLEVTGDNTTFDSSTTAYSTDGGGITVTDVSVSDRTHATVSFDMADDATPGLPQPDAGDRQRDCIHDRRLPGSGCPR